VVEPQGDTSVVVAETAVGRINAVVPSIEAPITNSTVGLKLAIAQVHLFGPDGTNLFTGLDNIK